VNTFKRILSRIAVFTLLAGHALGGSLFAPGNLVVYVSGNGVQGATSGSYADNQASPLSLFQFSPTGTSSATYVNSLVLPQTKVGSNYAISAEYGSSSEGALQLSGNGRYLTVMGYGIAATTFNNSPGTYSINAANTALAQTGSIQNATTYTPVPRVVALIDADGNVDTTTALFNIFNGNNPRSAYTADGSAIYVSGQGNYPDNTGGVFYAQRGATTATSITGNDATSNNSQDTRIVQIYNGRLYVSSDSKSGNNNRDFIGTLGAAGSLPTSVANSGSGPTQLAGTGTNAGRITAGSNTNGIVASGTTLNLSPESYFFANPSTLYIADTGSPKNDSGSSHLGNGGLQKWVNSRADGTGTWTLEYTIAAGLNLVHNNATSGSTGLYGLAGKVVGNQVMLYATNYTIQDLDQTYLYGITDALNAVTAGTESFTQLAAAPADSKFKGVSFAPTPEPSSFALIALGVTGLLVRRRIKR
jgi:hypothetical protein